MYKMDLKYLFHKCQICIGACQVPRQVKTNSKDGELGCVLLERENEDILLV